MARPSKPSKMAQVLDNLDCIIVLGDFGSVHVGHGISLPICFERIPSFRSDPSHGPTHLPNTVYGGRKPLVDASLCHGRP